MVPTGERVRPLGEVLQDGSGGYRTGELIPHEPDPLADPASELEASDYDEIQRINDAIGEIAEEDPGAGKPPKAFVYRIREGKRDSYLYDCVVQDWETMGLNHIRDTYGAGEYRIRVYHAGKIRVNRLLAIEAPITTPAPIVAPVDTSTRDALKSLETGIGQMAQMFAGALKDLASHRPPERTTADVLRELAAMRELFAPPPAAAPVDPLAVVKIAMEMASEFSTRADPETSFGMRALEKFGGPLMEMLSQAAPGRLAAPQLQPNPAPIAPVPQVQQIAPPQPVQPTEVEEMMIVVKMFLRRAIAQAAAGDDPENCANDIYELADDDTIAQFQHDPHWFDKLAAINPDVRPHAEWFGRVRECLLKMLTDEPETGTQPENQPPKS